ncbi:hypothetical protein SCLARK_00804 [Spiroplasma clarkii]|uniref:lipoprotein n=1 Tax=Spiroplasma clarkii TaxID=2139 RepID=UPI000B54D0A3|nr:lipoprotein [Spiroplasma clarkii]ARU91433.1 hypothetical protein SCLARK_00804 [Spiroplasma clarkii]
MKKLISILAATGLVATTSSSVLACNKDNFLGEATITADTNNVSMTVESSKIVKGCLVMAYDKEDTSVGGINDGDAEDGKAKLKISVDQSVDRKEEKHIL